MEEEDLTAWMGRPPPKPAHIHTEDEAEPDNDSDHTSLYHSIANSETSGDIIVVNHDTVTAHTDQKKKRSQQDTVSDGNDDSFDSLTAEFQHGFYIDIPKLEEDEKKDYEFLPGHFSVKRILAEFRGGRYLVKLESGEKELVSTRKLVTLENGPANLTDYQNKSILPGSRRRQPRERSSDMVDWETIEVSDSDQSAGLNSLRRKRRQLSDSDVSENDVQMIDDMSDAEDSDGFEATESTDRRSSRLKAKKISGALYQEIDDLLDDSDHARPPGRRGRGTKSLGRQDMRSSARFRKSTRSQHVDSSSEPEAFVRRSERTLTRPRRSMRERQEDEISAHSEDETGPKIVGAKEYFQVVAPSDPFRKRHRQECDTCNFAGDSDEKGPLVFCQGCTNAHHKSCLGSRTTRDHLVTKVGDTKFILQCRRCLGVARAKDPVAPHHGHCAACSKPGVLSKPLRARLTIGQEQAQREENGGKDPITIMEPSLVDNINNIMFRCALCFRAWHMHHLPERKVAPQLDDENEDEVLDETQLAQKRFDHYHRSWTCKDCIENKFQIDVLVAWRPVDLDLYTPGTTGIMLEESKKEYLIKWRLNSYLNTKWMPGAWVWGVAAGSMRTSFLKKEENRLPRMTTTDAIPEDYFRVDIVFDVHYTSVVRNSTKEIDLARVGEVREAFVKYKGLGYEDAIWENPPNYNDIERWNDFKTAYEDYVAKLHVSIPPQSTLRRHLAALRAQDFGTALLLREQPTSMTGGQMMQYQMEGLNWLYYQWFCNQNAILADEMGLGKTIQLIAFFALLVQTHKCWPFLVVVPNSTCPNWRREIKKWAPSLRVVTYYGSSRARALTRDYELFPKDLNKETSGTPSEKRKTDVKDIKAHIVVVSYESITEETTRKSLMKVPWQGLVVDEGQRLKNDKNLLYDCLSKIKFPFKVLLTGTPLQNNVRELFNLLQFLDRSMSAAEMEVKYAQLTEENIPELHEKLRQFFLRRTKAQVLTFLPPMAQIIVPVTMSTVQKKVYKSILALNPQLMKSIFSRDGAAAGKERPSLNNILMQLRKTLCHPFVYSRKIEDRTYESALSHRNLVEASSKLQLLEIMLPKLKERGHRVLMFSQFLDNLDIVEDFLDGLGLQHRRLDGRISALEKQKRIDEFNAPDSPYFAFLLSTRAGGVGINLATADTVIILDPDFNPHQDIQALSRAHRIGQKQKVLVFQLMTRDSAEEKIMQIGRKKMALDHILIERMDQDEDAGADLESILRHGAAALFDDEGAEDITYDSASVDRLLDRSQIEDTKVSEDKTAESQFSFARVWANSKSSFEDGLGDDAGVITPIPDIWDKILKEREHAYAEEIARRNETLGRGKRKRQAIDYGNRDFTKGKMGDDDKNSDTDFLDHEADASDDDDTDSETTDAEPKRPTIRARPFKRVKVPRGPAPYFSGDGTTDWTFASGNLDRMPPVHICPACKEPHPMGWCRLKIAGVEHCGLCGLAHLGHARTCPHLNSEAQVVTLLQTLKESTESRELVDAATKYLRSIRGDLVQRKRNAERRRQELEVKAQGFGMNNTHQMNGDNGWGNSQGNDLYPPPAENQHMRTNGYPGPGLRRDGYGREVAGWL